jgi:hypothetical protein
MPMREPAADPNRSRPSEALDNFGAKRVRALRGELSRAAFAKCLGVTALTVYRWELPDSAPEARRPRGKILLRLRAYTKVSDPVQPKSLRARKPSWLPKAARAVRDPEREPDGLARLANPIQRLTAYGMAPTDIEREFLSVVSELVPDACLQLAELDAQDKLLPLAQVGAANGGSCILINLGDGSGRRLRLQVCGAISHSAHELVLAVAKVATLSLEVARLRAESTPHVKD